MSFLVPNAGATAYPDQSRVSSADLEALIGGLRQTGVVSGCAVTASSPTAMTVEVASGSVRIGGTATAVSAGTVNVSAAHASLPRRDLLVVQSGGTLALLAGTPAASTATSGPLLPGFDSASACPLAEVTVPAAASAVAAANLVDKRVLLVNPPGSGVSTLDDLSDVAISTPATGQVVRYTGSGWANAALQDADVPSSIARDSEVTTALGAYQPLAAKSQTNGYASLDGGGHVPPAELGSGTPTGAKFLRDDQSFAVPAYPAASGATPAAETFGHAGAVGTAPEYGRADHIHPMPANPVVAHESATDPHAGYRLESALLTDADIATANKDGTTGTPSLRTLGTGALQAAAGTHTHAVTAEQVEAALDYTPADAGGQTFGGEVLSSSTTGGVGYATGAGGAVTQATSKSTGVTLNRACGQITMANTGLGGSNAVSFTLTNSAIAAGDILALNHISGGTAGAYVLNAQCAAGSALFTVRNVSGGTLSEAIVIAFAIVKAVAA